MSSLPTPTPDTDPNFLPLPNRRKVVIRDLPPALTEEQLLADLERLGISKDTVDYFHFVPGHIPKRNIIAALHMGGSTFHFDPATAVSGKRPRPGQCYLQFKTPEEPIDFAQKYNGHVFVDSRGVQYPVRVEYALYQKVPADWAGEVKANPMEGTWKETPEYKQWMQMKEEAANKAKEPIVFEVKGSSADDVPEPPKNALLSKVAKNAQKLLAKARTKANPGGSEPLAASVPLGPSPVAMAILTPKGPKTTPLIEYLKQQRELKLKKAKGPASAGSSPRAVNLAAGKVVGPQKQQQGSSRPGTPASTTKPAAGSGKEATDSAKDKKSKIKEQLKEKRKEKERERRERKKAERAAAKAASKASVAASATGESSTASQETTAKLPTPATSKKAADKLKKEMAAFTPTGIQKRVNPPPSATPSPAATGAAADDDQPPVLPFNLIQMSSSATQASPTFASSTAAERGSPPATSTPSFTSKMIDSLGEQPEDGDDGDEGDQQDHPQLQQQDQSNLSPEERARLEKLRIKREKAKEKRKEKRKAERVAIKEAKKAARAAASGPEVGAQSVTTDGDEQGSGAGEGGQADEQQQKKEVITKQKPEKKKRERPNKKDKGQSAGGEASIQSAAGGDTQESSINASPGEPSSLSASDIITDTQLSRADNDMDTQAGRDSSSASHSAASRTASSTPSARGTEPVRGTNMRGGARGNQRGSVAGNPPKSPPMQPIQASTPKGASDWVTSKDTATGDDWAAGSSQVPQQQPHRESQQSTRGGHGGTVRGRGGRGGFTTRNDVRPPSNTQSQGTLSGPAADWATSNDAGAADWAARSNAVDQQQVRRQSEDGGRGGARGGLGRGRGGRGGLAPRNDTKVAQQASANAAAVADWAMSDSVNAGDWDSNADTGIQQQQQPRRDGPGNARGGHAGGNRGRGAHARGGAAGRGSNANSANPGGATASNTFASVSDWAAASDGGSDWANAERAAAGGGVDWAGTGDVSDSSVSGVNRDSISVNRGGRGGFGRGGRGGGGGEFRGGRGGGFQGDFRGGRGGGGVRGGFRGDFRGGRGRGGVAGGPGRDAQVQTQRGAGVADDAPASS